MNALVEIDGVVMPGSVPYLETSAVSSKYTTALTVSIRRIVGGGACARPGRENVAAHRVARAIFQSHGRSRVASCFIGVASCSFEGVHSGSFVLLPLVQAEAFSKFRHGLVYFFDWRKNALPIDGSSA